MKILHRYLFKQVLVNSLVSIVTLTLIVLLLDAFKRVAGLIMDNDIPFLMIIKMIALLVPPALTLTIPWGLLTGILVTFGRMCHDLEITALRAAGLGLVPFVAPVILLSLFMSLICFYNNAILAPGSMTRFKTMITDIARENPTMFLRAQEPVDRFGDMRIYVDKKYGNTVENVHIWFLSNEKIPTRSIRADRGIISVDLQAMELTITLFNVRQEERGGGDPTSIEKVQTGLKASQLPITISLRDMLDTSKITENISILTLDELGKRIFGDKMKELNLIPLLTELQKRLVFSMACFTFALVGIPLAITTGRKETSIGFVLSLGVAVTYFLLVLVAMSLKKSAAAYPELIVWLPNILFQGLGFWLLWKVNRHPL